MKHAIIILMILVGCMLGLRFGLGYGKPLDYASAPPAQQQQWLENNSASVIRKVRSSLPTGYGLTTKMTIEHTEVSAGQKTIFVSVRTHGKTDIVKTRKLMDEKLLTAVCPALTRGRLAPLDLKVIATVKDPKGNMAYRLTASRRQCEQQQAIA